MFRVKPNYLFYLFFVLLVIYNQNIEAQNITLKGKISDSISPLPNANILAFPDDTTLQTKFAISSKNGEYILKLEKGIKYNITVSYLGYEKLVFSYSSLEDDFKNLTLKTQANELDEVVLNYKIPIEIKEDTIIYDTDAFTNGKERKLREVLNKLPGIEVDREGNVTAQGQQITKVLVENKTFFTGNSKLAVNNIPADAVGSVEVLSNYNEVSFLKGLQDSDDVVLNIRLKEGKKKFAFGDLEGGGGIKDRYLVHPTVFYYSPKTNINFIGDFNNVGVKSFTFSDYIKFEGGFGKLITDTRGFSNLLNDDFSRFLGNTDFKESVNKFGAFNIRQSISAKTDLSAYVIWSQEDTKTETNSLNTFISGDIPFEETRTNTSDLNNKFLIGRLSLKHDSSNSENLTLNSFIKLTNNNVNGNLLTDSEIGNNFFNTLGDLEGISLKQNGSYSKQFSNTQTVSLEAVLNYKKNDSFSEWLANTFFLNELLPLQNEDIFNVFQNIHKQNINIDAIGKDYWAINNSSHIYTTLGASLSNEDYTSSEEQRLVNGDTNSFSDSNFGNNLNYRFRDIYAGIEYKFLIGDFTIKSGLFYHDYEWKNRQLGNDLINKTDALLPQFNVEGKFSSSEKLRFRYRSDLRFPESRQLIGNFLLNSFNSVIRGNPTLSNERFDSYFLSYSKFSLFRGVELVTRLAYNRKSQSVKTTTLLEGIEQFTTYTLFNTPENNINLNFLYAKRKGDFKVSLRAKGAYSEFFQLVNNTTSLNITRNLSGSAKLETYFEKGPNLEFEYTFEPSYFQTSAGRSVFTNTEFKAVLDYIFYKDFHLKADYSRVNFKSESEGFLNKFNFANTSLYYQKEDSSWGFEVSATNLFNTQFKQRSSLSNFIISNQSTFILPRILLLKISYKL